MVCGAEGSTTSFWVVLDVRWALVAPVTGFMRPTPETEGRRTSWRELDGADRGGRALKDVGEVGGGREAVGGFDIFGSKLIHERWRSNNERHAFRGYMHMSLSAAHKDYGSRYRTLTASPFVLRHSKTHSVIIEDSGAKLGRYRRVGRPMWLE